MGGYIRLLITVSICCCVMGFLMWLFLKCYKKASIWILLLCTGLLLVRFLYPHEFSFTHTIGVTIGYPTINDFFQLVFYAWQISLYHCTYYNRHLDNWYNCVGCAPALSLLQAAYDHPPFSRCAGSGCSFTI